MPVARHLIAAVSFLAALAVGSVLARAQAPGAFVPYPQRPVTDPAAVERGKSLFSVNCAFCHGADARGGDGGPSLMRSNVVLDDKNGELMSPVVVNGRTDRGMPSFSFTPQQVGDVAAFLHSLPVNPRAAEAINIVVGDARAGQGLFSAKCASCHSPTGDLKGVGAKYADPKILQQTWLVPGTGGSRGAAPPRPAPPIGAVVTLADGRKVEGTLDRIDDFSVSLNLADGRHQSFRTNGPAPPTVELRDPLRVHKELLRTYSDADIHNITAYLVTLK